MAQKQPRDLFLFRATYKLTSACLCWWTEETLIQVSGAGGVGSRVDGIYRCMGWLNGRPKYRQVGALLCPVCESSAESFL